jgi:beta-carotene hydroxylase
LAKYSPDNHSRNFVSPTMNWLVFQAGYHTVHHEHATAHWSHYPALHATRSVAIDPGLNERTILGYCLKRYVLRRESIVAGGSGLLT